MKTFIYHRFETVSALGVLLWGVWLLNPFVDSFVRFTNSYAEMAKHASENAWGAGAFLIGLTGIIGILKDNKHMRRAGMLGALTFRTFTLIFIGLQTHFSTSGIPDFSLWALMALMAYVRIDSVDA